jgi:hypothetical protein
MKTLVCIAALMWLSCTSLLAQSSDKLQCPTANPAVGYAPPVKLPKSKREIKVYNVDYKEINEKHDPVCLSESADDTIIWVSGSSKKFKIKIRAAKDQLPNCMQHPFLKDPPTDTVDGYFSGSLNPRVPNFCTYEVEFQIEGGQVSDPHIKKAP